MVVLRLSSFALLLIGFSLTRVFADFPSDDRCRDCHGSYYTNDVPHHPALYGKCGSCHGLTINEARQDHLDTGDASLITIERDPRKTCFVCHRDSWPEGEKAHGAVAQGRRCLNCHNPHGSKQTYFLPAKVSQLCVTCHKDISLSGKHNALGQLLRCTACHDPHGSKQEKYLRSADVSTLCFRCHNGMFLGDGEMIPNIKKKVLQSRVRHPPAKDCLKCHFAHPRPQSGLFVNANVNAICLGCHSDVGKHPVSGHPISGPRDPVHPRKGMRPMTCASCHQPHGGDMESLFRYRYDETTPYKGQLCALCHWSKFFKESAPPPPPWDDIDKRPRQPQYGRNYH